MLNGEIIPFYDKNVIQNTFKSTFVDNLNNIWITTNNGFFLLEIKKQHFKTYFQNAGKQSISYDSRGIWADDTYLYSCSPFGANRWHFEEQKTDLWLSGLLPKYKGLSVFATKEKSLWLGSKRLPLIKWNTKTDQIEHQTSIIPGIIWSLLEDKNGRLWLGQQKNGLAYYDPNLMETPANYNQLNGFEELKKGIIIHLVEDKRDNNYLWISAQSGWYLLHIKDGVKARFGTNRTDDFKIPTDNIHYTYQDKDDVFWLATASSGLLKITLDNQRKLLSVEQFTTKNGLTSNTIYGIFEDEQQHLWLSTNNGINRFDKVNATVQAFLKEDGLPSVEFNRVSSFQRKDGTIFFGSLNGIVSFHPKDLSTKEDYNVALKISKCERYSKTDEKIVDVTPQLLKEERIVIAPGQRFVTLYVALQDYFDAPSIQYAYRIKRLNKEFTFVNNNEITLSGLPYGYYKIEIKAKGKDGRFSTQTLTIPLIIQKPFYLQWWFIVLSIVAIVLLGWQVVLYRTNALKNRQEALEFIVQERTQQIQKQANQLEKDKNTIEAQAIELRSLDKMKSRFFANISHELRTPLTLILSPVRSILKRQKTDNRDFTSAQIIEQNAEKLLKRINEILDLTKLDAKKVKLNPYPTSLYEYSKRLSSAFESLAQQKNQELLFEYQLDKDLVISLDQDKFEHIFNNYVSNAIKYTPKSGKIIIRFSEKKQRFSMAQNWIVLEVIDNGQGIHQDDLPYVFDRFFQTRQTKNKQGSSGIGLALSKEIATLMNGQVSVTSELGKGSCFQFIMPYIEQLGSLETAFQNPILEEKSIIVLETKNSEIGNKPTILLVEDNPQLRSYIQLILQEKYNVITAENGQIAMAKLPTANCQLIISDIMMPFMDGFELLEKVKADEKFRNIPFIILTALAELRDKLKALRTGVDDYLLKPFQETELLARIDNLLHNYDERQAFATIQSSEDKTEIARNEPPKISNKNALWLQKLEKTVKAEMNSSIFGVDYLSDLLSVNRKTLYRKVKQLTGLTPNQYIRSIRLELAKKLFESDVNYTITEVGNKVGFQNIGHFSKLYKQAYGKDPIEYL